jgi:hypothetical protein
MPAETPPPDHSPVDLEAAYIQALIDGDQGAVAALKGLIDAGASRRNSPDRPVPPSKHFSQDFAPQTPDVGSIVREAVAAALASHEPSPAPMPDPAITALAESVAALAAREYPTPNITVNPPHVNVAPPVVNIAPPQITVVKGGPVTRETTIERNSEGDMTSVKTIETEQ